MSNITKYAPDNSVCVTRKRECQKYSLPNKEIETRMKLEAKYVKSTVAASNLIKEFTNNKYKARSDESKIIELKNEVKKERI